MTEPSIEHLTFTGRERRRTARAAPWTEQAKCRIDKKPTSFFYPHLGDPTWAIATYCRDCPVRPECLDAGLHESWGWFGGMSTEQRNEIRWRLERRYVS